MIFLESWARPLLVIHCISAAILVGATTHHLLWSRHYVSGEYKRVSQERIFALVAACAFAFTFLLGNLLYPTYKVRVRAEYFDNPPAVAAEVRARAAGHETVGVPGPAPSLSGGLQPVARRFDIKEHWVALGLAASWLLLLLSRRAHPKDHPRVLPLYLGLSALACGSAWLGAIVGVLTAAHRAVGGAT